MESPENDEGLVWKKRKDNNIFMQGRDGDMLLAPFQCDLCWFRNVKGRNPEEDSLEDESLLSMIRRVNLDMMWSSSNATVSNTWSNVKKSVGLSREMGISPTFPQMGPWPVGDEVGFSVALQMVKASLRPGKHSSDYQQFDTIRSIRTAFSNVFEASAGAQKEREVFRGEKGVVLHPSKCPTQSLLFEKFSKGLLSRMGRDVRSNSGLSHLVLVKIIENLERELQSSDAGDDRKHFLVVCGFYFVVCFVASLRGCEGFMVERSDLIRYVSKGKTHRISPHVVVPLLGRFKGETGEKSHLLLMANTTGSGIQVRKWVERMVAVLQQKSLVDVGPAICFGNGDLIPSHLIDSEFKSQVNKVKEVYPDLVDPSTDVKKSFAIFRSLRRGSQTRATEAGVDDRTIDMVNRWRKRENRKRGMPMRDHYTDMQLILERLLKYSRAL